jgi:hypothetical protein
MGYRLFDTECQTCGDVAPSLLWADHGSMPPKIHREICLSCGQETDRARIISLIAEVHLDKELSPVVYGGAFDTAGCKQFKTMAEIPPPPDGASKSDRREHIDAYKERFQSSEWKEMKKENASIAKENALKQKRLAALKRGEPVNMRKDKLPGDPKVTA